MRDYHDLILLDIAEETRDSRRLTIDVPEALRDAYRFKPGQHLPIAVDAPDGVLRRTYSICSAPGDWPLELGIRVQKHGKFSDLALSGLRVGGRLRAMPPAGRFSIDVAPSAARRYVAFAAGSGITPVLSMIRTVLRDEPGSRFTLFYGNRRQGTTMFIDDLFALKNRYPERLQMQFVFSRERQEFEIADGRLDAPKTRELMAAFFKDDLPDAAFICGPDSMIDDVSAGLREAGLDGDRVHAERFGVPSKAKVRSEEHGEATGAQVTVIIDGHRKTFEMDESDTNIVDAAASQGIELPFSCKGGVCATCRTFVRKGEVDMALNYGLEPWEVEAGFVLACQSRPTTGELLLDYDKA